MKTLNASLFFLSFLAFTSNVVNAQVETTTANNPEQILQTRVDTFQSPPPPPPNSEDSERSNARRPKKDRKRPAGGPPSAQEAFKMFDMNADGQLTADEVKGPLLKDFEKIDTDRNGSISLPELTAAPKPGRPSGPPPKH